MYPGADDGYTYYMPSVCTYTGITYVCSVETFCAIVYKKRDEVVHRENKIRRIYGQRWRKYI